MGLGLLGLHSLDWSQCPPRDSLRVSSRSSQDSVSHSLPMKRIRLKIKNHNHTPSTVNQKSTFAPQIYHCGKAAQECNKGKQGEGDQIWNTDTYVVMEPGKAKEFVNLEELRVRLKGWLENWPTKSLHPDLVRFESIDDAGSFHLLLPLVYPCLSSTIVFFIFLEKTLQPS
ncbi:hypothetical protein L1987_24590 [Smallanthus sonchifolius]|uniref:Uncharacterized protein n=1 Tax=Smallanthus sonchifolius TaxID=185202 RepID=A0ACB9ILS2_9ASTR|nr:hypothetical protein L1987_24590 [Smallanthus sonchifolius]